MEQQYRWTLTGVTGEDRCFAELEFGLLESFEHDYFLMLAVAWQLEKGRDLDGLSATRSGIQCVRGAALERPGGADN
jgi:hypothetical protein